MPPGPCAHTDWTCGSTAAAGPFVSFAHMHDGVAWRPSGQLMEPGLPALAPGRWSYFLRDSLRRLFLDEWDKGFMEAVEDSEGRWLEPVHGSVPPDLCGTLFRWAGRGCWQVHGRPRPKTT